MKIEYIEMLINAVIELVKAYDESRDTTVQLKEANLYVKNYLTNQNDLKDTLEKLLNMRDLGKLDDILYGQVLLLIFDLLKQNKSFAKGLNYIINKEL